MPECGYFQIDAADTGIKSGNCQIGQAATEERPSHCQIGQAAAKVNFGCGCCGQDPKSDNLKVLQLS